MYVTTSNMNEAERIADMLVREKLAACVNIIENVKSVYRWKGIKKAKECLLIGKTKSTLAKEIITMIKKNHSYTNPCITFMPIIDGSKDYIDWIRKETKD